MSLMADFEVKNGREEGLRRAVGDPIPHRNDSTVFATFNRGGRVTIGDVLRWYGALDPTAMREARNLLLGSSDSMTTEAARRIAVNTMLLRAADSAGMPPLDNVRAERRAFLRRQMIELWDYLGINPSSLAGSAAEREKTAADRATKRFLADARAGRVAPISVPVERMLDAKYRVELVEGGPETALRTAIRARRAADSLAAAAAKKASQPDSAADTTKR
jgi:hypothetical protein